MGFSSHGAAGARPELAGSSLGAPPFPPSLLGSPRSIAPFAQYDVKYLFQLSDDQAIPFTMTLRVDAVDTATLARVADPEAVASLLRGQGFQGRVVAKNAATGEVTIEVDGTLVSEPARHHPGRGARRATCSYAAPRRTAGPGRGLFY